jgi:hypothetical protein
MNNNKSTTANGGETGSYALNEKDNHLHSPTNLDHDHILADNGSKDIDEEDSIHYVTGVPLIFLAFGLCVTIFLVGLDQMIIATAIPKITTLFNSLGDVGWWV